MATRTLVGDIETDGLLLDVSKFWVGVTYCIETKETEVFYDALKYVEHLQGADLLVFHNGVGYDLPALEVLTGIYVTTPIVDTLILGKLAYYNVDKSFGFSLGKFGERLGFPKGEYSDWSGGYTKEMEVYCIQDVKVTTKLYTHLKRKTTWLPTSALHLEQQLQQIVTEQYMKGFYFDVKRARELHILLTHEKEVAEEALWQTFKPLYMCQGPIKTPAKPFRRLGVSTVGPHQPIKLTTFNAGSGKHIVWWVTRLYGKQEWKRTDKGSAKTDAETLMEMFSEKEWAKPLLHYLEVTKILGQLAEGPAAWLKLYNEKTHSIHGGIDILGTVSGRSSHSRPNLGQVPSVRAFKGEEARDLFTCPSDKVLVGCDLSGVELRCLAHYMYPYDGGRYANLILESDIHTANQEAAGLPTRDQAKTMIYCLVYGGGDGKLGSVVGKGAPEGKRLKDKFYKGTPGYKQLTEAVAKAAKKRWLKGITGRRLYVRSPHSALNVLLQSLGSYISKQWLVEARRMAREAGIEYAQVSYVHDETTWEVNPEDAEKVSKILEESAVIAGEKLGVRMRIDAEAKTGRTWKEIH